MSRRGHALVLVALVFPIAAAACSSGSDSTATTSAADTVAPTIESTTTEATTTTTTTEAPTTTIDPADAFAAEVEADLLETLRLTNEASHDPTDDEKVSAALAGYIGGNLELIRTRMQGYRETATATRPNPDTPAQVIVETEAVRNGGAPHSAIVQVCEVDTWIVVEVGGGPNGTDSIVNSDVASYRSTVVLDLIDGRWRIKGGERLGEWIGATECPAES